MTLKTLRIFTALLVLSLCTSLHLYAQVTSTARWHLAKEGGIYWNLRSNETLPHADHIAMSGQHVDLILEWNINSKGEFQATRVIRWPMLRTIPDDTHASLQKKLKDQDDPIPFVNGEKLTPGLTKSVEIFGLLTVTSEHNSGVVSTRTIFPSVNSPAIIDLFELKNTSRKPITIRVPDWRKKSETEANKGVFGKYIIEQYLVGEGVHRLAPNESTEYAVVRSARKENDAPNFGNPTAELAARGSFIRQIEKRLVLETPVPILNRLFAFSKLRAAESVFSTRGGLMHGPGGYNKYLAAIWANDQAEYVNPFFPFLGESAGNESAMNSFRHFARKMNPGFSPIPSSIVAEGRDIWNGAGDRGDAAMIAYGAARFGLASGNPKWSSELWPLIKWCLEYSRRKKNKDGVVTSKTDELEGRFPAGSANLSTSSLYYDALISSAHLAKALGEPESVVERYRNEAKELREAIKKYFEADVEGFATYQYYQGNTVLRSWIAIPLTVNINDRKKGTVAALFSPRLWTKNGLLTKAGTKTVWDRSTLYALRGVLASGETEKGLAKLRSFSKQRLLGDHVPYVIEAFPEQNQSHLSAESGLYCRIFTEGIFGIRPTGFRSFDATPRLPEGWNEMALLHVRAFGMKWNMTVSRAGKKVRVRITNSANDSIYDKSLHAGQTHHVSLH